MAEAATVPAEVPDVCRRDGCGGSHWHPVTGEPPDYHYQCVRGDRLTLEPRWRRKWQTGKDRREWLYSVQQVAEATGLHVKTVLRHLNAGRLKGHKLGLRVWRIRGADLEAFIKGQSKVAP